MTLRLIQLDHLIVIARTLAEGIDHVAAALHATPTLVTTDAATGRRGARLALWQGLYVDVIAPGNEAPPTGTPRRHAPVHESMRGPEHGAEQGSGLGAALDLDNATVRRRAANGPFLAHWAARVERPRRLARWAAQYPRRIPPVRAIRHGAHAASAALEPDGGFPAWRGAGDGLLPTLLQWDTPQAPTAAFPETGIALKALRGFHPAPELIGEHLRWLGLDTLLTVEPTALEPHLVAEFDTPTGIRTLA